MKTSEREELLHVLKDRFERHGNRHPGLAWAKVLARLEGNLAALRSLRAMESSGGRAR